MIRACLDCLEGCLKNAGVARVYDLPAEAAKHQAVPYAVIALGDETLQRDGSLTAAAAGPAADEKTYRRRLYRRSIQARVKIVHRNPAAAGDSGDAFLKALPRRIFDKHHNAVLVNARGAEADEEDAGLLKRQSAAYFLVTFEGGVYADNVVKRYPLGTSLEIESGILVEEG